MNKTFYKRLEFPLSFHLQKRCYILREFKHRSFWKPHWHYLNQITIQYFTILLGLQTELHGTLWIHCIESFCILINDTYIRARKYFSTRRALENLPAFSTLSIVPLGYFIPVVDTPWYFMFVLFSSYRNRKITVTTSGEKIKCSLCICEQDFVL